MLMIYHLPFALFWDHIIIIFFIIIIINIINNTPPGITLYMRERKG